ncbi:hypothetical protein [Psychroflexus tropicus]|uniref:hypothetical protein n=1 Tax=Psychroflexus tropicus TaxID=197345 RepID=UPI0003730A9F|nr:hypothetical protein [Psychroflexus tropicus]
MENVVFSDGTNEFIVNNPLNIEPNSYLVFSNNNDVSTNGSINVDFEYDGFFSLPNSGGQISITSNTIIIDFVNYDSFNIESGKSLNLNPNNLDAVDNDNSNSWCISAYGLPSGDFGTPKLANTDCN